MLGESREYRNDWIYNKIKSIFVFHIISKPKSFSNVQDTNEKERMNFKIIK